MEVVISGTGRENSRDLAQLRDWLESAGGGLPWQLTRESAGSDDSLGSGIDEICAIVSVAAQLPALVDRIREWFPTRHDPKPIQLRITLDPAAPKQHEEPEQHSDERLA